MVCALTWFAQVVAGVLALATEVEVVVGFPQF
jgi:hypothetical protein